MDGDEFKFQNPNEEEEETLSLCDLPLYSDDANSWDKFENNHDQSWSSLIDKKNDLFEFSFSSEEFSSSRHYGDNIVFCGKLMACNEPLVIAKKQHEIPSNKKKKKSSKSATNNHHKEKKRRFFRWRLRIFTRSKTPSGRLKVEGKSKISHIDELDRVTAMKCRAKCKWYFFMFGSARFPLQLELHDIKTRQYRRSPSSLMFRSSNHDGKLNEKQRNWGFWRLLKTLSCIGHNANANALVNSSYGCTPRD